MIWYASFAAAAGVREGFHIRIVALENVMPPGARRIMHILANLAVAACGLAMLVWGGELIIRTWGHVIPSLGLPRGVAYLGLPVAGALIALFAAERILEEARGLDTRTEEETRWS
jgi:TRAP-type C4-dicarboxylate transport system permease small subunit